MAMRYGHKVCSHVRMKSLLGVAPSLHGRSYCSGSSFPVPVVAASSNFLEASTIASTIAVCTAFVYSYNVFGLRSKVEDLRADMKVQQRLKRLNSEKLLFEKAYFQMLDREMLKSKDAYLEMLERVEFEPEYAYLEMLEREVNVLKEKLIEREIGLMDVKICQREVAVLKEMLQETRNHFKCLVLCEGTSEFFEKGYLRRRPFNLFAVFLAMKWSNAFNPNT